MSRPRLTASILSALVLSGCAFGRNVLPIDVDAGRNPPEGVAVRIDSVEDARAFAAQPSGREVPSLAGGDLRDKSITSRVVARKHNTLGMALGDVVLPEGSSVTALVQGAITRGLRESGYRVLGSADAGYEQAAPIKLRVEEFWSWSVPGVFSITLINRTVVAAQGTIAPFAPGRTFSSQAEGSTQITTDGDWAEIVAKGLDALTRSVRAGLR